MAFWILGIALALGACAGHKAEVVAGNEQGDGPGARQLREQLVGVYQFAVAKGNYEEYDRLTLDASGVYTADKPNPTHGAAIPESGGWRTAASNLILFPTDAAPKRYEVTLAAGGTGMKLSRGGKTEQFDRVVDPARCGADSDCPSGQECRFVPLCPSRPGMLHCLAGRNQCVSVAREGERCGFRTQTVQCARGLDCRHAPGTPLDALTCLPHVAQYGESCDGFVLHPTQCDVGLVCSHIDSEGHLINPDLPGVCFAGEGAPCGGSTRGAHQCASPLRCVSRNPDIAGVCVP